MYKKDLIMEWFGLHLTKCSWYLEYPKDCTPFSKVSLHESFEPGFTEKALNIHVSQGPKRSRDSTKKKGKEKFTALETVVGIERPHDDFPTLKF
jgi:hypothetical protein